MWRFGPSRAGWKFRRGWRGSVRVDEMHADAEQFACVIDDGAERHSGAARAQLRTAATARRN